MKTFTESLIICGDYKTHHVIDNPDVIIDPYQLPLRGRHCDHVRIFTERQRGLTSYEYDFEYTCEDEATFFEGLEANAEWFTYNSLYFAADDLRSLITRGIVCEEAEEAIQEELTRRVA